MTTTLKQLIYLIAAISAAVTTTISADQHSSSKNEAVTLINTFIVPHNQEQPFEAAWLAASEYMQKQPGFISTQLHRSINPDSTYRYINIAKWQSISLFQQAFASDDFTKIDQQLAEVNAKGNPALYTVVKDIRPLT